MKPALVCLPSPLVLRGRGGESLHAFFPLTPTLSPEYRGEGRIGTAGLKPVARPLAGPSCAPPEQVLQGADKGHKVKAHGLIPVSLDRFVSILSQVRESPPPLAWLHPQVLHYNLS